MTYARVRACARHESLLHDIIKGRKRWKATWSRKRMHLLSELMKGKYVALKRTAEDRKEWQKLLRAGSHTPASQQITWMKGTTTQQICMTISHTGTENGRRPCQSSPSLLFTTSRFNRPLSAGCPSSWMSFWWLSKRQCHSTKAFEGNTKHGSQAVAWPHPFFT